ncbi:MAG: cation-efflux pump [bacterium]
MNESASHIQVRPADRARRKNLLAAFSVLVGVVLTATKLVVGLVTGSLGILSEALHSLFDLGAAVITFFSVRISSRPADESHTYGHGKVENISALVEALLLLATCVWVVHEAVARLAGGKKVEVEATFWSFFVMGLSVVLDVIISRALYAGARRYGSQALEADALHYSSDILSSAVVIAGLIGTRYGYPILDPVAALGVAALVAFASVRLSVRAVHDLLDTAPKGLAQDIRKQVAAVSGVESAGPVRVRRAGASTFVDLVAEASRLLSLDQADRLADRIEAEIRGLVPESDVVVHLHPTATNETVRDAARAVSKRFAGIEDVHNVSAYRDEKSGRYFLSLHAKVAPELTFEQAHALMDRLEEALKEEIPELAQVETHMEIADGVSRGSQDELREAELGALRARILEDPLVLDLNELRRHRLGSGTLISCRICVARELSMEKVHAIATRVEEKVRSWLPEVTEVVVHTEPIP